MSILFVLIMSVILAAWVFRGAIELRASLRQQGWRRPVHLLAAMLFTIGAVGFLGSALSSMGVFHWPNSFEWPAGYCSGVVTTPQGHFMVPLTRIGRVQIYDQDWKFVRGWNVDASSGAFKLFIKDTNHIQVVTVRGRRLLEYDFEGHLLSSSNYQPTGTGAGYSSFPSPGNTYIVPTPIYLWVFSSPFLSWGAAIAGMAMLKLNAKWGRSEALP